MRQLNSQDIHRVRRQAVIDRLGHPLLLRAAPQVLRNGDVEHPYRQDSDFFFLTGFDEPGAILYAAPNGKSGHHAVLFVRPRDPAREQWDGPRAGVRGAIREHGADAAHPIGDFPKEFRKLASEVRGLGHVLGADGSFDAQLFAGFAMERQRRRRNLGLPTIIDPRPSIHALRQIKSDHELASLRGACAATAAGFAAAMTGARGSRYEYEVQADMEAAFRHHGSPRNGYESIVASGANACVLHYIVNDRRMRNGELLLIDAGAEVGHHTADVTRTFPVGERFSPAQRAVYQVVLRAQKRCIAAIRPGLPFHRLTTIAERELTRGLKELGVLKGDVAKLIAKKAFRPWYMHGIGHWLGMDVHDAGGDETADGKSVPLAPGMVLTVEPGLYFGARDRKLPAELRGIGVRIEDDVLVTKTGHEVLTAAIPKEIAAIEALRRSGR